MSEKLPPRGLMFFDKLLGYPEIIIPEPELARLQAPDQVRVVASFGVGLVELSFAKTEQNPWFAYFPDKQTYDDGKWRFVQYELWAETPLGEKTLRGYVIDSTPGYDRITANFCVRSSLMSAIDGSKSYQEYLNDMSQLDTQSRRAYHKHAQEARAFWDWLEKSIEAIKVLSEFEGIADAELRRFRREN